MSMERILTKNYYVSAAEASPEGEISLPWLTSKLIGIATDHANQLGVGNPHMNGAGWVLSRLTIEMGRYPKANENYSISTWVEKWNSHFSQRCFEITDSAGATIGYSRSIWMALNFETRRNYSLDNLDFDPSLIAEEKECPIAMQRRHREITPESTHEYHFKYSDLDFYRHVNTLRYLQLLLNCFPLEVHDASRVSRFEIAFMKEGRYDEKAEIKMCHNEDEGDYDLSISTERGTILHARLAFGPRE